MPIYEYLCESCGHEMEKIQKMSDEPLKDCPSCAKPALRKLVSAAAFRLKGDGWYETDFKTGSKKNALHRSDSSAGDSSASSGGSKSDQKKSNATDTKKSESSTKSSTKSTSGSASGSSNGSAKSSNS